MSLSHFDMNESYALQSIGLGNEIKGDSLSCDVIGFSIFDDISRQQCKLLKPPLYRASTECEF